MYEKFKLRTPERLKSIVQAMKQCAANDEAEKLQDLEVAFGFKYDQQGLIFDDTTSEIVDLSKAVYCDTAHCISASGGIGQYHINQLVLRIVNSSSTTLADIDSFSNRVSHPVDRKLTKTFFQDRIVVGDDRHMKCFASETLTAIVVIGMFVDMVLVPAHLLVSEVLCFKHLESMLFHIQAATIDHAQPALESCRKHHEAFLKLYPLCAKPKFHYLWHSLLSWIALGVRIDCLGAEAEHKAPKRIMNFAYKKCFYTSMSFYLRDFLQALQDDDTFSETHLTGRVVNAEITVAVVHGYPLVIESHAIKIATPIGNLAKGDLLRWGDCIGVAQRFIKVRIDCHVRFFAVMIQYVPVVGMADTWEPAGRADVNVCTDSFCRAVAFVKDGRFVRPHSNDMHD